MMDPDNIDALRSRETADEHFGKPGDPDEPFDPLDCECEANGDCPAPYLPLTDEEFDELRKRWPTEEGFAIVAHETGEKIVHTGEGFYVVEDENV